MEIELTKAERDYLETKGLLAAFVHKLAIAKDDIYCLEVDADVADDIRNLCADRLQISGFDRFDQPTLEGLMLERLIDKFFTG